jgi:probable F420-dependent oxidoreductase
LKIGFFAVGLANLAQPELLAAAARAAERVGIDTLWTGEHIVFFDDIKSKYPYARTNTEPPIPGDTAILNPFVALAYAAAITSRIRLATGVCLIPEYNPLLLAKLAASLDFVSGGRFVFGVGIGWLAEEFQALGIPWARRGARARETVAAMRELWEQPQGNYAGEFGSFTRARSYPQPPRNGKIPIIVGGQSDAALRRAAAWGDGWCGFNLTPAEAKVMVDRLHALLAEHGRAGDDFEIFVSPLRAAGPETLEAYRDAGVDELYLTPIFDQPFASVEDTTGVIEDIGRRWVTPAARFR